MKKKFTDEELSRILSAHAARQLQPGGCHDWWPLGEPCHLGMGCVNQVAFNEPGPFTAEDMFDKAADWFDNHYNSQWSADEFLVRLQVLGVA